MNTTVGTFATYDVCSMPGYKEIRARFMQGFYQFLREKRQEAACYAIQSEFGKRYPFLLDALFEQIDSEAVLEKPGIYLSVNVNFL
jgi:hypothetical protein